ARGNRYDPDWERDDGGGRAGGGAPAGAGGGKRRGHGHVYPEAQRSDAGEKLCRENRAYCDLRKSQHSQRAGVGGGGSAGGNLSGAYAAGGGEGTVWSGGYAGLLAEGVWPDGT